MATLARADTKAPSTMAPFLVPTSTRLLQRKCACHGAAGVAGKCEACSRKERLGLHTTLQVNQPGDSYEQVADRVADQVMTTPADSGVSAAPIGVQRFSGRSVEPAAEAPASVNQAVAGSGQQLEPVIRQEMEQRFGHDFSRVRVHTNPVAAQSARDVDAHAYTVGQSIVFGAGRFAPRTLEGRRLIAHELTHVLQQNEGGAPVLQRQPDSGDKGKAEGQPTAKFVGCDTNRLGVVQDAIKRAEELAKRAVFAFERDYSTPAESTALRAHFGSLDGGQKATIVQRYKHAIATFGTKTYTCAANNKRVTEGSDVVDTCGQAACPGSAITLYPAFGSDTCPAGPVMLHEAIHNAGGCDDINKGASNYPPSASEDNAYSYEYFALDLMGGYKTPEPGKRKPAVPKVKP